MGGVTLQPARIQLLNIGDLKSPLPFLYHTDSHSKEAKLWKKVGFWWGVRPKRKNSEVIWFAGHAKHVCLHVSLLSLKSVWNPRGFLKATEGLRQLTHTVYRQKLPFSGSWGRDVRKLGQMKYDKMFIADGKITFWGASLGIKPLNDANGFVLHTLVWSVRRIQDCLYCIAQHSR